MILRSVVLFYRFIIYFCDCFSGVCFPCAGHEIGCSDSKMIYFVLSETLNIKSINLKCRVFFLSQSTSSKLPTVETCLTSWYISTYRGRRRSLAWSSLRRELSLKTWYSTIRVLPGLKWGNVSHLLSLRSYLIIICLKFNTELVHSLLLVDQKVMFIYWTSINISDWLVGWHTCKRKFIFSDTPINEDHTLRVIMMSVLSANVRFFTSLLFTYMENCPY